MWEWLRWQEGPGRLAEGEGWRVGEEVWVRLAVCAEGRVWERVGEEVLVWLAVCE